MRAIIMYFLILCCHIGTSQVMLLSSGGPTDYIRFNLSTSQTAYDNATHIAGFETGVEITATEYDDLFNNMENMTKTGASGGTSGTNYGDETLIASNLEIPNGNYPVAVKIVWTSGSNTSASKIAWCFDSTTDEYYCLNFCTLPVHNGGTRYYTFKRPGHQATATDTYLGVYATSTISVITSSSTGTTLWHKDGDHTDGVANLDLSESNTKLKMEFISTSTKQW